MFGEKVGLNYKKLSKRKFFDSVKSFLPMKLYTVCKNDIRKMIKADSIGGKWNNFGAILIRYEISNIFTDLVQNFLIRLDV